MYFPIPKESPQSDGKRMEKSAESEVEKQQKNRSLRLKNDELEQIIALKEKYAGKALTLVVSWLVFVLLVFIACAWNWCHNYITPFNDNVLIALIGGSSANIIGLFAIVLRHIFPGK